MEKQLIIAVSREYGTGGHRVAKALADKFGINFYDRRMLEEIADQKNMSVDTLHKYDELPRNVFISRTVRGMSNSPEEAVANFQFDYIREKADSGESFVILGRCAEHVLKDHPALITVFILGDKEDKLKYVEERRQVNAQQAAAMMYRHDKKRKAYHNYYCPNKWGDARGYDVTLNISKLGVEKAADFLESYVRMRIELNK